MMPPDPSDPAWARLVCPICFDLGYEDGLLWGQIGGGKDTSVNDVEATGKLASALEKTSLEELPEVSEGQPEVVDASGPGDIPDENEIPVQRVGKDEGSAKRENESATKASLPPPREENEYNPTMCRPMRSTLDGTLKDVFTVPVALKEVEAPVSKLLKYSEGESLKLVSDASTDLELTLAMPKAQFLRNGLIPLRYWIQQGCPVRVGADDEKDRPCVAIRKALHEHLKKFDPSYNDQEDMLLEVGFVESGMHPTMFRVGYLSMQTLKFKDGQSNGDEKKAAYSWAVDGFMAEEIPSTWRHPWFPSDGFALAQRGIPSGDTSSDEAFKRATRWFQDCISSHTTRLCALSADAPLLPGRVIDLGPPGGPLNADVKLSISSGNKGRYICLSHRWGDDTTQTSSGNLEDRKQGIKFDSLSKTFQDVLTFARRFSSWHRDNFDGREIRYVWIDSLCIVQDDPLDWIEQSQKMCDIYSNALLTVVEAYSTDREKRLFQKMGKSHEPLTSVEVADAAGKLRTVHFREPIYHPDIMVKRDSVPIWSRGWVLQERILSQRLLIFGPDELAWQCAGGNRCECGVDDLETVSHQKMRAWRDKEEEEKKKEDVFTVRIRDASSRKWLSEALDEGTGDDSGGDESNENKRNKSNESLPSEANVRRAWRLILEQYSGLTLTFPKDTLPAIAGLARSFAARLPPGKKYLGGVWYTNHGDGPDGDSDAEREKEEEDASDGEGTPGAATAAAPTVATAATAANTQTLLDLLWRVRFKRDAEEAAVRSRPQPAAVPMTWNWASARSAVVYPFTLDEVEQRYAYFGAIRGAQRVDKLPENWEELASRPWLRDMYTESPPSALVVAGPVFRTRPVRVRTHFQIATTEDREYTYFMGSISDAVFQERALGRPVEAVRWVVSPPLPPRLTADATASSRGGGEGREADGDGGGNEDEDEMSDFARAPPICFYPDEEEEVGGLMYCLPLVRVRHRPVKQGLRTRTMLVALVLEAVAHMATDSAEEVDLSTLEPGQLVFQRRGLAYTPLGDWSDELDRSILGGLGSSIVHIL